MARLTEAWRQISSRLRSSCEFGLMDMLPGKSVRYLRELQVLFGRTWHECIALRSSLNRGEVRNAILMGPNAHRVSEQSFRQRRRTKIVTYDVEVLFARTPIP